MDSKVLIAYYSWSGKTESIAGLIQKHTGGELFRIKPVNDYPGEYSLCTKQAKEEIRAGFKPEIEAFPDGIGSAGTVFIGSPIWWYTMAPPVHTFISGTELSGKKVVPFCSHGGGGQGHFSADVAECCPGSALLEEFVTYGSGGPGADGLVAAWLLRLGLIR